MLARVFPVRSLVLALTVLVTGLPALAAASVYQAEPPLTLGGNPRVDPDAFRVTVFADGLFYPLGMTELPDGSILVATSNPTGGSFYTSTGELIRLVDADGDGVADGPGEVLVTGLPGAMTDIVRTGDLIYAVSAQPDGTRIAVLRLEVDAPAGAPTWIGSIDFLYETPMRHGTFALAVRPIPGSHELFFNVGSVGNDTAGANVFLSGLVKGTLTDSSIYRLTVDDSGPTPVFSEPTLIAVGLRNAAGIAVDPTTGDLYFEDNGIDGLENPIVALSADELNRIAAGDIGGTVEDFGFPSAYVDYATGEPVGNAGIPPLVAFLPRNGDESEGASEIAFVPSAFPPELNGGIVVGFHGQWDEVGLANEENPVLYVDPATGDYFPLVSNDDPSVGHLDGLLATDNALYLADLTGPGSLVGTEPTGVIYRIAPITDTAHRAIGSS